MISREQFLEKVLAIEASRPVYRTGGTGADGACDCIGVVMGAMYALGHAKYPLHSSNYFARYQTDRLHAVSGEGDLAPGQVIYKANEDPAGLNARYLPGGTHDTGDSRDYYHAGVVISAHPLIIAHCTQSGGINGFTRDTSLGQWRWAGDVRDVDDGSAETGQAVVTVFSGTTANLRLRPATQSKRIQKVPAGTAVTILEQADGWARIVTPDGETGYMMSKFLQTGRTLEDRITSLEQRVAKLEGGE